MAPSRERGLLNMVAAMAVLGLLLSLYLLKEHLAPSGSTFCDLNSKVSCDIVNKSVYAELWGIPVSLLGALYWGLILAFALAPGPFLRVAAVGEKRFLWQLFTGYMLFGFAFSLYLTYIEAFVLRVWCPLCVASAVFVTLTLLIAAFLAQQEERI